MVLVGVAHLGWNSNKMRRRGVEGQSTVSKTDIPDLKVLIF
jgi:hypothetical protein